MNKKVLVITPFFAPESHAAVFRAHKLVKYLKYSGWNPYVITVDTNYEYNEDPALLTELDGIPVYRTRYIEPSIRGLKMALGGEDRTYKVLKEKGYFDNSGDAVMANNKLSNATLKVPLKSRLYTHILNRYLKNPDRFWTWKKGAIKKAQKLIKEHDIGTVFTTTMPFTSNQIGLELKKTCNIKWMADFRDPITYGMRFHSSIPQVYNRQKKNQDDTFTLADAIVGASSSFGLIFNDQYAGKYDHKFTFIPTGLDDQYIPEPVKQKDNVLIFVGEYLKEYKDYFFKIYKEVIAEMSPEDIPEINIIGNKEINQSQALTYIRDLNIEPYVTFFDHMPQRDLYERVERARYVLLINGDKSYWWCVFAKLIDYIALKKEVIAFIPEISEAKKELKRANTAHFFSFSDDDNTRKLKNLFLNKTTKKEPNIEYCKRYLASSQAKAYIDIFKKLQS